MEWFYARGDMQRGPVSEDELADLIKDGIIAPETRVWREGMEDWQPLAKVPEIADRYLGKSGGSGGESGPQELMEKGEGEPATVDVPKLPESVMRGQSAMAGRGMPPAYTAQAITALVFGALCCTPVAGLAVVALVHGSKVKHLFAAGDYDGAQEASDKAKKWCNITALALIAAIVIFGILIIVSALTEEP
jgi:hypothetical protein